MSGSFLLGLLGEGIGASLTPAMQEREGGEHGLALEYRVVDAAEHGFGADDLGDVLLWAERLEFDGLNVTHPFKQRVLEHLHELSDDAADLGAVNTVLLRDGRRTGHNTDWSGWARAFRSALPRAVGDAAVVLGAGGAGVAVGYGLLEQGAAHVAVHDLDPGRAEEAVNRLAKRFGETRVGVARDLGSALTDVGGVVNATPVGMHGHPGSAVDVDRLDPAQWVGDVVYFPLETELVRRARHHGCRVVPGGGMAVHQAAGAFELFTGLEADAERMRRHFTELTARPGGDAR